MCFPSDQNFPVRNRQFLYVIEGHKWSAEAKKSVPLIGLHAKSAKEIFSPRILGRPLWCVDAGGKSYSTVSWRTLQINIRFANCSGKFRISPFGYQLSQQRQTCLSKSISSIAFCTSSAAMTSLLFSFGFIFSCVSPDKLFD